MKPKNVESFIENMLQWDTDTTYPKKMNIEFAIKKKCLFININNEMIGLDNFVNDFILWTQDGKGNRMDIGEAITQKIIYIDDDAFVNVTKDIAAAITALDIRFTPVLPPADDFRPSGGSRRHCKRNPKKSTKRSKIVKHSSRTMSRRKYKNRK